jgi:hypothetical protein
MSHDTELRCGKHPGSNQCTARGPARCLDRYVHSRPVSRTRGGQRSSQPLPSPWLIDCRRSVCAPRTPAASTGLLCTPICAYTRQRHGCCVPARSSPKGTEQSLPPRCCANAGTHPGALCASACFVPSAEHEPCHCRLALDSHRQCLSPKRREQEQE